MADFKTHIGTSTALGLVYGGAAYGLFQVPPQTASWPRAVRCFGHVAGRGQQVGPPTSGDSGFRLRHGADPARRPASIVGRGPGDSRAG